MKVLVGSTNPVKIEATTEAFSNYFKNVEVIGINVDSGVPNQPINDETFAGAQNRAQQLKLKNEQENLDASFFVGIEGGIAQRFTKWFAFGGICIIDSTGKTGFGTSIHFELPENIVTKLLAGAELGDLMDKISGVQNTKQKGGAIEYFTKGLINRKQIYVQGLVAALIPFINETK